MRLRKREIRIVCFQTSGLAHGAYRPLIACERGSAGSRGSRGSTGVVRRIKNQKRRGGLNLAVFSYRNLIPSHSSLATSHQSPVTSHAPATHLCFQTCGGSSAANRKRNDTRMPLFLNSRRSRIIWRRPSLTPLPLQNLFVFHHLPANRSYRFGSGASIGRMETSPAMTRSTFSPVSTRRQPSLSISTALPV